jgi:hypothetical protein
MVPRILSNDQKRRLHVSSDLIHDAEMLDSVISSDGSWCSHYDPGTNRQSMQRETQNSPQPQKARTSRSQFKTILVCFVDHKGISSLRIHCTRTTGQSTVLFGSADKVTGIRTEEKTRTLASQVDSPP